MKSVLLVVVSVLFLFGVVCGVGAFPGPEPTNPGVGTPGYWKNHPNAWPTDTIWVADWYSKEEAIDIMKKPTKKDMTYKMFAHLCAATLNVMVGNEEPPDNMRGQANVWLYENPLGSGVTADSDAWQECGGGETIKNVLDAYNNGSLNVPPRD